MIDLRGYVAANPGCTVTDIAGACGVDGTTAWTLIIDAERRGEIRSDNSDNGRWHFYPEETP